MSDLLGCQPSGISLAYYWSELDFVSENVDMAYCSKDCPCDLTNTTGFTSDPIIQSTYSQWKIQNNTGVVSFLNCSQSEQTQVGLNSSNMTAFGNFSSTLYLWRVFERSFNCTGWCSTTYNNPSFNETTNTCMNADKITPCNCTDSNGSACSTCVDKSDNSSLCTNYTRPVLSIEKYLYSDINRYYNL